MPNRFTAKNNASFETKRRMEMEKTSKSHDKSTWAIGGGVLMGVGAGFFFLKESPLAFVACILPGIGLGLVIAAITSRV
jgi:hypothetical protein